MADDRNQKQPDYYNPDNFFADESFGTSLGDDYSSFFSDDEPNAGGDQPALADTGEQDLSSWLAETEKEQKQMFEAGTAGPSSDFWSIDDSAGQNSQGHGPRKDTGSASQYGNQQRPGAGTGRYGTQQTGTGGSQHGNQQQPGAGTGRYGTQQSGTGGSQYGNQQRPGAGTGQYGTQQSGTGGSQYGNQQQPGVGTGQYGTQQPGTGGSQYAGQQPAGTNDGPVILGGIDGGKGKRKKSMLPFLIAAGIGIILIIAIIPAFLHKKTDPQQVTVIDEPDDEDDDTYVSYQEEEPDYGKNYNDYYTNQYIMAKPGGSSEVSEICVYENDFAGSPESPRTPETYYSMFMEDYRLTMIEPLNHSYLDCGFTIVYGDREFESDMSPGLVRPPVAADQDRYFQMVKTGFSDLSDYEKENYQNVQYGEVRTANINGHTVAYMEATYHDDENNEILDTFSFEETPQGNNFLTEYRCRQAEFSDGGAALEYLYSRLTFYTEDFESIDAGRHMFTVGRVYNESCTDWAEIDLSDEENMNQYGSSIGSPREMYFYFSGDDNYSRMDRIYWMEFNPYSILDGYDSFDQYVDERLKWEKDSDYKTDVEETDQREFFFYGRNVYYYSYKEVENYGSSPEDVTLYCFLIENGRDETFELEIREENLTTEGAFDPEAFLEKHLKMN